MARKKPDTIPSSSYSGVLDDDGLPPARLAVPDKKNIKVDVKKTTKKNTLVVKSSKSRGRPKKDSMKSALQSIMVSDADVLKWMQLVELRGSSNELYRMADRFQANLIITGILTIQEIYKGIAEGVKDETITIDHLTKLTTSFNRAVASINQALSYLGVTGNKREDEPETDALADFLRDAYIEVESLPLLQTEFLSAQQDMARMDVGGDPVLGANTEVREHNKSVLAKLKKPMQSYKEDDELVSIDRDEKVVDVELDRSTIL